MPKIRTKRKSAFWIGYFIFYGLLIVAISVMLFFLWGVLDDYEKSQPKYLVESVTNDLMNYDNSGIADYIETSVSEFEDTKVYEKYISDYIKDKDIKLAKKSGAGENEYNLKVDNKNFATVHFKENKKMSKYGFSTYDLEKITDVEFVTKPFVIKAPSNLEVFINDIKLESANIKEKDIKNTDLVSVEGIVDLPTFVKYEVKNLINPPIITIKGEYTSTFEQQIDDKTGEITIKPTFAEDQYKEFTEKMIETAKMYTEYTTNDRDFSSVATRLLKDTSFYKSLRLLEVMWYTPHDSYEFKNIKTDNYIRHTDDLFTYDIEFDHYVYRKNVGKTFHFPTNLRFSYVKTGDEWLVAAIEMLEE